MLTSEQRIQATVLLRVIARDQALPDSQRLAAAGLLHELAGGRDTRIRSPNAVTRRPRR